MQVNDFAISPRSRSLRHAEELGRTSKQFKYLADPVFITALILYPLNRFYLKPHHLGGWFTHGYFTDLLTLPMFVPITLYIEHLLGLRPHRGFPQWWEQLQVLLAFTVVFQLITPRFPSIYITAGDHKDILAYAAGGLIAQFFWTRFRCKHPAVPPL